MENRVFTIIAILFLFCVSITCAEQPQATKASIVLAENSKSNYKIVLAEDASNIQKFAGKELQSFLKQICQAELPIITDSQPLGECEIILGQNKHLQKLNNTIDFSKLGKEGFTILTAGNHIIIAGGPVRGTLYGVYTFLEKYLGCRWYTSKVSRVPQHPTISLPQIDDTQVPVLDYREVYYADAMDPNFAARLKLNGNASTMKDGKMISERHAGWGTWCHTSFSFVPPEKYFEEHPEYYSLINGKRQAKQLCFTNPEILEVVSRRMRELIAQPTDFSPSVNRPIQRKGGPLWADAEDHYWDISQMDGPGACQCPNCQAIDQRQGSHIGSVLTFINMLAAEFPNKTISTLSYQYTRTPPKNLRPAPNVSIMLCNIECTRSHPIPESPFEVDKTFASDLEKWSKICNNLFIWDYVVNFGYLYAPNPNLRIQQTNIKYFIDHNVKGIFCQGSREVGGEFSELRNYLLAKLLWNPDCNVDEIIDDFLSGYYGPAAPPIRRYIDLLHDSVESSGKKLGIYDAPQSHAEGYLSPKLLKQYDQYFDQAERLVAYDEELLLRVQTAFMPVMYVQIVNQVGPPLKRLGILEQFFRLCKANHILRLSEWGNPPEQFYSAQKKAIQKELGVSIYPAGGYIADFDKVIIEMYSGQPDVEIRYTLDGSEPGPQSTLYKGPFHLAGPATVIANTFQQGKGGLTTTTTEFHQAAIPMESPLMHCGDGPIYILLPIQDMQRLKLIVSDGGDGTGWDHADWADAKLIDKNGKTTYLTDLTITRETQGWGQLGIDKSIAGNPLRIGNRTFKRGLGAHAKSEIVYDLGGKYEYFEAWIGIDAEAKDEASVRFMVLTEQSGTYKIHKRVEPMVIDANWNNPQWQRTKPLNIKLSMGDKPEHLPKTKAKLLYDDDNIYVIFKVEDRYVRALATKDHGKVWEDSCVEFFFTPSLDISDGYFNVEANCIGTILFNHQIQRGQNQRKLTDQQLNQVEIATSLPQRIIEPEIKEPVTWTLEYRLPLKILEDYCNLTKPAPGVKWRANFYKCADKTSHPHWLTWSYIDKPQPDFHRPEFFGTLEFLD